MADPPPRRLRASGLITSSKGIANGGPTPNESDLA
jgi:hypothetical protein